MDMHSMAKNKCHSCYEFHRRNGFNRNEINLETKEIVKLKTLSSDRMSIEKAFLIRNIYNTKRFSNKFIANSAGISISYFNLNEQEIPFL